MFSKKQLVTVLLLAVLCLSGAGNAANLVVNPGFETAEGTSGGLPNSFSDGWKGDYSAIVGPNSGITPLEGSKMLQFLGTSFNDSGSTDTSDIFQIIDISSCQELIATGNAKAEASVYFNRVAGDAQTDAKFAFVVMACDGLPSTFPSRFRTYGYDFALSYDWVIDFYSDSLPDTWEEVKINMDVPVNTTFLVVNIDAGETTYNDLNYPEFDGHFADNVSVQIVPEPSTMILLAAGIFGLRRRK